ncbi:PH domain-containing protein [Sporosarcina highlanderae]|uniref:PH domain-containing protein n=1 Tax=Sporosarcina highlanderae TaxID=3035916 RepID=A0ABT8JPH8_9BACL|nr:PH domain-containing protein [Sporosarcina highlanderae]MDN4606332.1 PH domain-containing protein [Sporosarcina highlanderae]
MSEQQRYKLHWITAIIEMLKTMKEAILPLVVLVFANGWKGGGTGPWYFEYLSFIIFGVLIISLFVSGIIKWKRFEYWFEDDELRIESGLFVKKKRYIPFDRIQSLDYTEGIFHRPFGLVKVKVETAGGSSMKKAEGELTAITKVAAERIKIELAEAKKRKKEKPVVEGEVTLLADDSWEVPVEETVSVRKIFSMSTKDLLILATTSGGIGVILSGVAIFMSQFADLIPFEWMYEEISAFIKFGVLIVAIAVFLGLLGVWILSVGMTFLSHYNFTVSLDKEDIIITRGLLEKKRVTVPLKRIQSVVLIENPFRKVFGYVSVKIHSAGGGVGESSRINLFPLVKRSEVETYLSEIFPELYLEEPSKKPTSKGRPYYYRIDFVWMLPVIGALIYFFFPYGLFSLAIIPVIVAYGIWQHRSAAYEIVDHQLIMRFRTFSLQTAYTMKKRIQSMEMKQSYFHRRKGVATILVNVKSGMGSYQATVQHMDVEDAEMILDWYEKGKKTSEVIVDKEIIN